VLRLHAASDLTQAIALGRNPCPLREHLLLWSLPTVNIRHSMCFTYVTRKLIASIIFSIHRRLFVGAYEDCFIFSHCCKLTHFAFYSNYSLHINTLTELITSY